MENKTLSNPSELFTQNIVFRTCFAIILLIIIVLSIAEMVFVCYVIHRHKLMKIKVWFYLYILTISDSCLSLLGLPITVAACIDEKILLISFLRNLNGFSFAFFGTWSTLTLAAISIQKYLTISKPLGSLEKKDIFCKITYFVITFLVSFTFAVSPIFGLSEYSYMKNRKWSIVFLSKNRKNDRILSLIIAIFAYLIPIIIIMISSRRIYVFIRKQSVKRREKMRVKPANGKSEEGVVLRTLLLVTVAFFVLWTPLLILMLLGMARVHVPTWFTYLAYTLMFMKGPVNPFIYCYRHDAFRKCFKRISPVPITRPKLSVKTSNQYKGTGDKVWTIGKEPRIEGKQVESNLIMCKSFSSLNIVARIPNSPMSERS